MTPTFNYILWNVSPEIFSLGKITVRWYGLLFALGFLVGQQILIRIYKQEGKSERHVETLTVYMVIATIIGARLGHVLFYDWDKYKDNLIEIFYIWEGGLASHGAAIGILIAIYIYSRKATHQSYFYVLDRLVITIALAGCLIRLGNLMNSEIIGTPTNAPTAFLFVNDAERVLLQSGEAKIKDVSIDKNNETMVQFYAHGDQPKEVNLQGITLNVEFKKNKISEQEVSAYLSGLITDSLSRYQSVVENIVFTKDSVQVKENRGMLSASVKAFAIPRHPAQLYEAISSLLLFLLLWFIYSRTKEKTPEGRIFGLFVVILFSLRFIYEYNKENQVEQETALIQDLGMNIGQLLSIPFVLIGLFILMRSFRKKNEIN